MPHPALIGVDLQGVFSSISQVHFFNSANSSILLSTLTSAEFIESVPSVCPSINYCFHYVLLDVISMKSSLGHTVVWFPGFKPNFFVVVVVFFFFGFSGVR